MISLTFRVQRAVRREEVVLTYCWVIVDPPWVGRPAVPATPPGRCRSGRSRVGVEVAVLGREHGLLHVVRDLGRAAPTRGCPARRRAGPARSCRRRSRRSRPGRWRGRWGPAADRGVGDGHRHGPQRNEAEQGEEHPLGDLAGAGTGLRTAGAAVDPSAGSAVGAARSGLGAGAPRSAAVGGLSTHDGPVCGVEGRLSQSCACRAMYRGDISVLRFRPDKARVCQSGDSGNRSRRWPRWRVAPNCSSSPSSACSTRARCTGTSCASGSTPRSGRSVRCPTAPSTRRCATCSTGTGSLRHRRPPEAPGAGAPASSTSSRIPARNGSRGSSTRPGRVPGRTTSSPSTWPSSPARPTRCGCASSRAGGRGSRSGSTQSARLGAQPGAAWTPTRRRCSGTARSRPSARSAGWKN